MKPDVAVHNHDPWLWPMWPDIEGKSETFKCEPVRTEIQGMAVAARLAAVFGILHISHSSRCTTILVNVGSGLWGRGMLQMGHWRPWHLAACASVILKAGRSRQGCALFVPWLMPSQRSLVVHVQDIVIVHRRLLSNNLPLI